MDEKKHAGEWLQIIGAQMRFILNFFFFGLLFYLIWMFFPDAFKTLVSWADQTVAFLTGIFHTGVEKFHTKPEQTPAQESVQALLLPITYFLGLK